MRGRHVVFAAALAALTFRAGACTLTMALEQWPPYIYNSAKTGITGLDLELAQAILKEAGCTLLIQPELPTARRQILFQKGELNLMLAASDTPERHRYARFSVPYRYETVSVFTTADKLAKYRHLAGFDGIAKDHLPLLAPKVGWYGRDYARVLPALSQDGQLSTFGSFQQGVRMLAAGRAELILGDAGALRYEAHQQGVKIAALPFVALRASVHLMLNTASTTPAQLEAINAAIGRLEQGGELAAIRLRYGER
ncbi:substrate-binding periplasmic protein [Rugamonas sp. CCM 8940]|uniref:substrate-binding periplasmic protein n=1 Tax=Rugamonas sp. CCM 8940 TaxID=2765359 RepID=UPI0018F6814D|nr:transporter substrate-binding domain-containing protein [Rugamonas sp. CCM 8940]MBJ7310375.1 transporter substrate-binding domain-containing protein [Rugamonas sp. CCM 8940]